MSSETPAAADEETYQVSWQARLRRAILRPIARFIFHLISRVEIEGRENIPASGGYVIAHNHISLFEPPFVLAFWPTPPEAIAGADVFERPGQSIMVKAYAAIPVHRGEYDRNVIETVLKVLRAGRPLVIAPEGGRSHELALRQARAGVAYLVDRAQVPVLPVGIIGTSDDFMARALRGQRPPLKMKIGEALHLPAIEGRGEVRRATRQRNADLVMRSIADLLPPEYHGHYV